MRNVLHLIGRDLAPVLPKWLTANERWQLAADSSIRLGFHDLLVNHAEAARVYHELYPET